MKIDYDGRVWSLTLEDIDLDQGEKIGAYTGLSIIGWYRSLLEPDALAWGKSMRCLFWLMCQQNDVACELEAANCKPLALLAAFNEAAAAENKPAEPQDEDPTKPADGSVAG